MYLKEGSLWLGLCCWVLGSVFGLSGGVTTGSDSFSSIDEFNNISSREESKEGSKSPNELLRFCWTDRSWGGAFETDFGVIGSVGWGRLISDNGRRTNKNKNFFFWVKSCYLLV